MRSIRAVAVAARRVVVAVVLAACGSSGSAVRAAELEQRQRSSSTGGYQSPLTESLTGGKKGGTLQVLNETDFEHLDPGSAYYSLDYPVVFATQRPLYSYKPNTAAEATPDLASGPPEISSDGKTVTVHLREGVHFSPPVNREVTQKTSPTRSSAGPTRTSPTPTSRPTSTPIEGVPTANGGPDQGDQTPDKHTIVFHLTEPKGAARRRGAGAAARRRRCRRNTPKSTTSTSPPTTPTTRSRRGRTCSRTTARAKCSASATSRASHATLVRNPNWNASTDFRPAYLNEIQIKIGGTNTVIGRQVLEGTQHRRERTAGAVDRQVAAEHYKTSCRSRRAPGPTTSASTTSVGPFKNVNLRRALLGGAGPRSDGQGPRRQARHRREDPLHLSEHPRLRTGRAAWRARRFDFNEHPQGDMAMAEKYMKDAGYPSGKYTGATRSRSWARRATRPNRTPKSSTRRSRTSASRPNSRSSKAATMYSKYCNVPKEEIDVCPSVGWIADFGDPQTVLNITFNGKYITGFGQRELEPDRHPAHQRSDDRGRNA